MKKIIIFSLLLLFTMVSPALSITDRKTSAENYNRQGELALKHAQNPNNPPTLKRMYYKEAKYFFTKSTTTYPHNFDGFLGLAKAYMYLGVSQKSFDNYMIAYNFNPDNVLVNYYLGEFHFLNEKYRNSLVCYKRALDLGYANHYRTNFQIAICYDKLGDSTLATKYYKRCLDINPDAKEPQQKLEEIANKDAKYKDYYNK